MIFKTIYYMTVGLALFLVALMVLLYGAIFIKHCF